jgi:hypothetical protein
MDPVDRGPQEPTTMNDGAGQIALPERDEGERQVIIETRERHSECAAFRLLVEGPTDGEAAARDVDALPSLVAGDGVLALDAARLDAPTLEAAPPDAAVRPDTLHFERIEGERGAALLMRVPRGLDVRINGRPSPPIALLAVADQVQVAHGVLHVTRERDGVARRPSAQQLGRKCPVCSVPIDRETRIVVHECGALLHAEQSGDRADEADLLQCSSLTCPDCDRPVVIGTGLVFTPEL